MRLAKVELVTLVVECLSLLAMIAVIGYIFGFEFILSPGIIFVVAILIVFMLIYTISYFKKKKEKHDISKYSSSTKETYDIKNFDKKRKLIIRMVGTVAVVIISIFGILTMASQFGIGPLQSERDKALVSLTDLDDYPEYYVNQTVWVKGRYAPAFREGDYDYFMGVFLKGCINVSLSNNLKGNLETGEVYYMHGTFLKDEDKKDCYYLYVFEIG